MKTKLLMALLCLFPLLVVAQNYEQQGDELFAQAQYEKAIKKYNVAIELGVASSHVSQKVQNAKKCISLSTAATSAENNNSYSKASELYTQLYELNAIQTYKEKIAFCKRKIKEAEQARIQREAEEREKAREEAERKRIEAADKERHLHPEQWKKNRISKLKQLTAQKVFKRTQPYSYQLLDELYLDMDENNRWITTGRTLALMIEIDKNFITTVNILIKNGNNQDLDKILKKYKNLGTDVFAKRPFKYGYSITEEQIAKDVKLYMEILVKVRKNYSDQIKKEHQNWETASRINTIDAYMKYINEGGLNTDKAKIVIDKLYWQQASKIDNIEAYKEYLSRETNFPKKSEYKANKRIDQIRKQTKLIEIAETIKDKKQAYDKVQEARMLGGLQSKLEQRALSLEEPYAYELARRKKASLFTKQDYYSRFKSIAPQEHIENIKKQIDKLKKII